MRSFICLTKKKAEKRDKTEEQKMRKEIENIVAPFGYIITDFKYYPNIFGNVVLDLKKDNIKHTFVIERGELYHNDMLLSYNDGTDDLFKVLLRYVSIFLSATKKDK